MWMSQPSAGRTGAAACLWDWEGQDRARGCLRASHFEHRTHEAKQRTQDCFGRGKVKQNKGYEKVLTSATSA